MVNETNTAAPGMGEVPELPEPSWYVVHTPGADFDYSFAKGKDELRDILDWSEAREIDVTKTFTADQMRAYAKSALSAAPVAAGGMGDSEIRRVIHELRTYNPIADEYRGAHIHSVWARELEAALAAQPAPVAVNGEAQSVAGDVMFGWRLAASNVCEKDAIRAAERYARKKIAP